MKSIKKITLTINKLRKIKISAFNCQFYPLPIAYCQLLPASCLLSPASCLLLFFLLFTTSSCKKFPIGPQSENPELTDTSKKGKGVFIICEGGYNWQNGKISYFDFKSKIVSNSIFEIANSRPLGDTPQSMVLKDSIGFIVVNNSGKIEIINTNTYRSVATISNLNSPRYMLLLDNTKAYISSLYSNSMTIINLSTYQITGQINVGCSSEQMLKYNNIVFVANWSKGNKVLVINSTTDQVVQSISVVKEPNSMVLDKNNKLWLMCSGGFDYSEHAALLKINPDNYQIEQTYTFTDIQARPNKLCINKTKDTLFYLNNGICKVSCELQALPTQPCILSKGRSFYGLTFDAESQFIYATNAIDYVQPGWVYRFTSTGIAVDSFKVDINPGEFCFKK